MPACVVLLLFIIPFVPTTAHAQTEWDLTGTAGLFFGYTPRTDGTGYQETWFESAQGGVTLGRYFTPNLKLELDATATNAGKQYRERLINVPGYPFPYPTGAEVSTSVRSLGAAVTWQFRDNEWVHPFVLAGVVAEFERVSVRTWEQVFYGDPRTGSTPLRVAAERTEGPATTRAVRPVLGAGAKLYVLEHAFVRADSRWTFERSRHHLAFRLGFGVDF